MIKRIITTISLLAILAAFLSLPVGTAQARPLLDTYTAQAGNDTLMNSQSPTGNFYSAAVISVGENNAAARIDRSLIKFDLSSIPSNAVITSATLSLWIVEDRSDNARDYKVYRVIRNWVDSQATWNAWTTGNNWTTAGASSNGNDADLTTVWATTNFSASESVGTEKQFSLSTTEVKKFINGTYSNYGWLIKADTETNDGYTFASFENATTSQRPKLVIVWSAPTPTFTATVPTATFTNTPTATVPTPTNTNTPTATVPTPTHTDTPTATVPTPTHTDTPTATAPTPTHTDTPIPTTVVPTETFTPTPSITPGGPSLTPVVPTWYLDPTITYGEYALDAALLGLCGAILVIGMIIVVLLLIKKKGMR